MESEMSVNEAVSIGNLSGTYDPRSWQDSSEEAFGKQTIERFYQSRYIFITGGTGFIGKVLLERLLRCCPDVAGIFLLTRPKKGRTPFQRAEDLCTSPVIFLSSHFVLCSLKVSQLN
jgi:hypothetical protein